MAGVEMGDGGESGGQGSLTPASAVSVWFLGQLAVCLHNFIING